ncbi:hypothetical protein OX90_09500 [Pseudomonas coronafaciens pv. porri]|uniref:Uncharacterized protein n=1 Tax=Pseudomonas coronafaciens pv. porri TaxID=83964 RepID=A0ABR5JQK7_9PSED|nr:hypothetical protein OX90_09500 [Pseudomonas coronafaciens pv. porri]
MGTVGYFCSASLKRVSKHRRTCKNPTCKTKFSTTDSRKLFCRPECKILKSNGSRKRKSTYDIPKTNHFLIYIAKEVERAGTLQVLDHLVGSIEALKALYSVVRNRLVANVLTGSKVSKDGKRSDPFHVAHIAPTRHQQVLGMLCADNLIVIPAALNRFHSNTHTNKAGVFMYRTELKLCNTVLSTDKDILERAIAYIGLDVITEFCREVKLTPSQRAAALKKLGSVVDHEDESHAPFITLLNDPKATTPQLNAAIETIQCKAQFKPLMRGIKLSASAMLIQELIRHAAFRPELEDYATIAKSYTKDGLHHNTLSQDSQATLSKLLHGYLEGEILEEVEELLYDLRLPVRAADARAERLAKIRAAEAAQDHARTLANQRAAIDFLAWSEGTGTLNSGAATALAKIVRIVPEPGSILPNGEVAF